MLPIAFTERMKNMLQDEYVEFEKCYEKEKYQALRFNGLKGKKEDFVKNQSFHLEIVPWSDNGFYYEKEDTPGKHPFHEAGVYYIQEPSAQTPATFLDARPGERVLDLCGAPGGKSTQIAAKMMGKGLLFCNEIHPQRAKILSENIERLGITNSIVTSENPVRLAQFFPGFFHRIMVDAPCSGEGMFRKNEEAYTEWSPENVKMCAERQEEILDAAADMLMPGGQMVYSTCTFAPEENEGSILHFLIRHPEFHVEEVESWKEFSKGSWQWAKETISEPMDAESYREQIEKTIRLWPHKLKGEGHFVAVLRKEGVFPSKGNLPMGCTGWEKTIQAKECKEYMEFAKAYLQDADEKQQLIRFGDQLYLPPVDCPGLKGIKVLRPGLHLGTILKNRFEPSHALALSLKREQVKNVWNLTVEEGANYLKGNTFPAEGEKGWYLIMVEGYSIGWGKLAGGIMKNHYPKGLRKN